jgi:hypothetical protein
MVQRLNQRGIVQYIVLGVVSLISIWLYFNQQSIRDWLVLRSYEPPQEIVELADTASLSDTGRRLFYVAKPELSTAEEFNQNCSFEEKSLVLGCFSHSRIYIFDVDSEELSGIEEVTAAHEMLHVVYGRMSGAEKQRIDELTARALSELNDERINKVLDGYRQDDPDSVPNELHSILGSEARLLPGELEEHYSRYFDDRLTVVILAESYEQVFTELQDKLSQLEEEITNLRSRITSTEQQLEADQQALDKESARLNSLRQNGQIEQYNSGVAGYNQMVERYNVLIAEYKAVVGEHNELVEDFNAIALEQNQLVQSINSKYQAIE